MYDFMLRNKVSISSILKINQVRKMKNWVENQAKRPVILGERPSARDAILDPDSPRFRISKIA